MIFPVFLGLLFGILGIGVYFILQSALDTGVLVTGETLRAGMMAGSTFSPPSGGSLKSSISGNGGGVLNVGLLSVDVSQLATLSSNVTAITDGATDWGGSGSILILRASATMNFIPAGLPLTLTSTAILRRPPY